MTVRGDVTDACRDVGRTVLRADLTLAYCAVVAALTIALNLISAADRRRVVSATSTNLDNLREHPLQSLVASAFVVPRPGGLVLVAFLLVALAYSQRFIGRAGALVIGLAGHIGATAVVAMGLQTGIFHDLVDPSVRSADDVGVSYVLASTMAFLTLFIPGPRRWLWCGFLALYWLLPGGIQRSFTDAGHAIALLIGGLMAFVCWRAVAAHLHHLGHGPEWRTSRAGTGVGTGSGDAPGGRPEHAEDEQGDHGESTRRAPRGGS